MEIEEIKNVILAEVESINDADIIWTLYAFLNNLLFIPPTNEQVVKLNLQKL